MKKRYVLSGLVLAALLLGGCGSTTTSSEPETTATAKKQTEAPPKPKGALTLEQAQEKVKFTVVMPEQLPRDLTFEYATVANEGVVLNFASPDKKTLLAVMQFEGNELPKLAPDEKELTVSGNKGSYVETKEVAALSWTDGKLVYHMMAAAGSELGKEAALVEIGAEFARKK